MAPAFIQMPADLASTNYAEPTSQETSPYFSVFNYDFWARVNSTPKLKREFDTYMASHKKGESSFVDLFPCSRLASGFNAAFSPVLLVDIGGKAGHQCIELKTRYPDLQGEIAVQDLMCTGEDLGVPGVKGMSYDLFTPQPIKSKSCIPIPLSPKLPPSNIPHHQTPASTTSPRSCTTGPTPHASLSCASSQPPCAQATRAC
jgi:demethylsterigmatocystin 6-O-methyltransferase